MNWLWLPKFMLTLLLFLGAAYLLVAFNYSYSDGNRAGYIQKFSNKGWICKTYEGEMAMTTVPGVAPVLWAFSVWDDKWRHNSRRPWENDWSCTTKSIATSPRL